MDGRPVRDVSCLPSLLSWNRLENLNTHWALSLGKDVSVIVDEQIEWMKAYFHFMLSPPTSHEIKSIISPKKTLPEEETQVDWRLLVSCVYAPCWPFCLCTLLRLCIFLSSAISPFPLFPGQTSLAPWGQMRRPSWLMCRVTTTRSQANRRWEIKWNKEENDWRWATLGCVFDCSCVIPITGWELRYMWKEFTHF